MKKIMFNDRYGLTEAVLSGRKTMTRRIVSEKLWDKWTEYDDFCGSVGIGGLAEIGVAVTREYSNCEKFFLDNSPFKIGEIVAIAQSYRSLYHNPLQIPACVEWFNKMFVRADLMPHQIRFNDHKVERLQDISDEDCIKEGIEIVSECENLFRVPIFHNSGRITYLFGSTPRIVYAALIDCISGKGTWKSNPFVFAYEFELVK